ncbi:hypothetical protein YH65_03820 [Sulfurovum lithotrophicum]|uniref:Exonuclease domain-containing protein n=1 Tax=Sulfurovum lithotrophicum TaxID=206403 RepID=A0A7U4M0L8_9BACT|nr:hypothetical protein YH65_03820 [Sulfurovum lithotrophicum]
MKNDRLIQLAFLKVQGEKIEAFNDLCYTDIEMNDTVIAVHNITNAMLEDKYWPYETDAFIELEKGNKPSNYFIAHGNELDVAMLEHEELFLKMQKIDTDKCARLLLKEANSYKLGDLITGYKLTSKAEAIAKKIGLEDIDAHDALSDALWHYVLFELLLEKAGGDIDALVTLTVEPMMLEKITFGKYKGKSFEEISEKSPLDLVWMYANMAADWPDLEYTLTHWLKQKEFFWNKAQQERKEAELLRF